MKQKVSKPNIFEYDNYRDYLKVVYQFLKSEKRQFSYRYFSRMAGFRSPNVLQLVMEGKRNLSPASIEQFSQALKLNKEETTFFRNLVLLNQASTVEEKKFYAEQLIRSRFYRKVHPLSSAEFAYYSNWYFIPIRELVGVEGFIEDPQWIAHQLNPPITPTEAKKALDTLEQLGLIRRNDQGKLVQTDTFVSTGDEVSSTSVVQFHKEMIQKGAEALDRFKGREREISSVTLALSEKSALQVKELIQSFRKELIAIASQDRNPTAVYQINFQHFPLSKKSKGESEK